MSLNRRDFLRRAGLIAAGIVAADQLDLLERLAPRRLWPGWSPAPPRTGRIVFDGSSYMYGDHVHLNEQGAHQGAQQLLQQYVAQRRAAGWTVYLGPQYRGPVLGPEWDRRKEDFHRAIRMLR